VSYRIGSFNINNTTKRDENGQSKPKDGREFAEIIANNKLDVLAIQEYKPKKEMSEPNEDGVAHRVPDFLLISIIKCLTSPWHRWKYKRAKTDSTGREYAILWNDRRLHLVESETDSRIATNYRRRYKKSYVGEIDWHMKREPLIARLVANEIAVHPWCEIRLIDVHLWQGKGYSKDKAQRKEECALVNGFIYDSVNAPAPQKGKTVFTITLGDYNLDCEECNEINSYSGHDNMLTVQSQLSTLNKFRKDNNTFSTGFSNSYDHFSYDKKLGDAVKRDAQIIDSAKNDFTYHLKNISDHLPIVIEIL
jgi:exonuclease III